MTCAWRLSPGYIWAGSCVRVDRSRRTDSPRSRDCVAPRAGGGEQAALAECLLAAMDAADQVPGAEKRLEAILDEARREDDAPVEVFALDALARIAPQRRHQHGP